MKLNIFITLTLLLCLALSPCTCRSNEYVVRTEKTKAYPPDIAPESSFSLPPSKSPSHNQPKTSKEKEERDSSQSYTTFSAAFSDIFRGSIRGRTLSMPDHVIDSDINNNDNKPRIPTNNYQAVTEICSHTDYPDICFSTISPFVPRHHFDIMKILEASLKACSYQTEFTISKMNKHIETSPELASALNDCKEQYTNVLDNLHRAMEAIPSRDLGTVTVMLSAVMADVSACESGFEDMKKNSPMRNSEGMVSITASNCLAIASFIPS